METYDNMRTSIGFKKTLRKYWMISIIGIVALALCFMKLFWLVAIVCTCCVIYWVISGIRNKPVRYIFKFLFILLLAIACKVLVFSIYHVPSESMEGTILPGDYVLSDKLRYGPLLPETLAEIPFLNIFSLLYKTADTKETQHSHKRLTGYKSITRGDIIDFIEQNNSDIVLIKRCIGLPGDTIAIKDAALIINEKKEADNAGVKQKYTVSIRDFQALSRWAADHDTEFSLTDATENQKAEIYLTEAQKKSLQYLPYVTCLLLSPPTADTSVYPHSSFFHWTINNLGPFVLPRSGQTITLTLKNYILYKPLFESFENEPIQFQKDHFTCRGRVISSYTFKNDYYFVLGDNRYNSVDSRFFGPIPANQVLDQAALILFSNNFRWSAFFKPL